MRKKNYLHKTAIVLWWQFKDNSKNTVVCTQIKCKYYAILWKGNEHLRIMLSIVNWIQESRRLRGTIVMSEQTKGYIEIFILNTKQKNLIL